MPKITQSDIEELLYCVEVLIETSNQMVWLHDNKAKSLKECSCKSCIKQYGKQLVERLKNEKTV